MTFRHLEDHLREEDVSPYLELFEGLQEPTKTVFGYALDIASHLDFHKLSDHYTLFGGYAVLSNLMDAFGDSVAKVWRGSTDVDMAGNHDVLNSIRSGYHISNDSPSPNIPNKRTLKLGLDGEKKCKIDFYLGEDHHGRYGTSKVNRHFGTPVVVVKPEFIVREKLKIPEGELHHYGDILAMLSVLEKQGYSPKQVMEILNHKQRAELRRRIHDAETVFEKDRFGFFPGKEFSEELKRDLNRRSSIGIRP